MLGVKEMEQEQFILTVYFYESLCTNEPVKMVYYNDVVSRYGCDYGLNVTKITIAIPPIYYSFFNCSEGPWNRPTPLQSVPCFRDGISPFQGDINMIGQVLLTTISFAYSSVRFGAYSLIRINSEGCIKETNPVTIIVLVCIVIVLVVVVISVIAVCCYKKRKTLPKK